MNIRLYILTLTVTVVGNREFVAALLASSLFKSAQALVTLAVRPTDRSTTASRCFALWTTHAPRPSPTHHALFPFFAPHFRATLCRTERDNSRYLRYVTICICIYIEFSPSFR